MSPGLPLTGLLSCKTVTRLLVKELASAEGVAIAAVRGRGMAVDAAWWMAVTYQWHREL